MTMHDIEITRGPQRTAVKKACRGAGWHPELELLLKVPARTERPRRTGISVDLDEQVRYRLAIGRHRGIDICSDLDGFGAMIVSQAEAEAIAAVMDKMADDPHNMKGQQNAARRAAATIRAAIS